MHDCNCLSVIGTGDSAAIVSARPIMKIDFLKML